MPMRAGCTSSRPYAPLVGAKTLFAFTMLLSTAASVNTHSFVAQTVWDEAISEAWQTVQMVLKCADIGHLAAAVNTHRRWAYQLEEEFFRQGDKEREVGLPVSPLMDRCQSGGMTRSQVSHALSSDAVMFACHTASVHCRSTL